MKRMLTVALLSALALSLHAETGLGRHKKLYVVPAPGKVVIDGKLDDWDLSPQIEMFVMSETSEQMSAKFSMMYSAEALYISGIVRDMSPMMNRQDPLVLPRMGWNADACQLRLSLDPADGYPLRYSQYTTDIPAGYGIGKVVDMTLWYFTDEQKPVLSALRGFGPAAPFEIIDNAKFEAVYLKSEDGRGYTFEYRIPWTTIEAVRPFKGGDLMAGTVQFNWSTPDGLSTAGGGAWAYDVLAHSGFPYQESTCWGKIIFSEEGNIDKALVEEGVAPPRPLPLTFDYAVPEDGQVSIVLFDKDNNAVRILTADSPRHAGEVRDMWDGMDSLGKPLPAGEYTWKGVTFPPMETKVLLSVHNSGQPGYATDDISSSWGSDHFAPTTVCAIPGGMLLAWGGTEMGSGTIRTDLTGRKLWGSKPGADFMATDGDQRFFVGGLDVWHHAATTVRVYALEDGRPLNFGNGSPMVARPEGVGDKVILTGLAYGKPEVQEFRSSGVQNGALFASYGETGVIGVYDAVSGDLLSTLRIDGTVGELAWDAHGNRLLAIVGSRSSVVAFSTSDIRHPTTVVDSHLDEPRGITADNEGNIYVANQGALQNVSMFDAKGKFLHGIGKAGGRPARGLYDENGMYMPGGIDISDDGRLWVAETTDYPKRHSVWKKTEGIKTEDQKGGGEEWAFYKEFFGGSAYFGWVWMDPADPTHVFHQNVKWAIDLDAGTWKPVSTIWRAVYPGEVGAVTPDGYNGHLRVITANNGKRYAYGVGEIAWKFYREDADVFKPFAGAITIWRGGPYGTYGANFPELFNNPEKYPDGGTWWWQDKNNDGKVQEDELSVPSVPGWPHMSWLDRDLSIWYGGAKMSPTHIDANGQPFYDHEKSTPFPAGGVYLSDDDSQIFSFSAAHALQGLDKEGSPLWAYRNLVGWHYSLGFPMVKPGLLHGLTMHLGVAGEFTGAVTYFNPYHIWTTDGIYVTALTRDGRDGRLGPDVIASESHQGQLVKLTMPGASSAGVQESGSSGVQNGDRVDRYFLLAGANDGRITEIIGLDKVRRLAGGTYILTEAMAEIAIKARQDYDLMMAKSQKMDIQRGGLSALEKAPAVERIMDEARRFAVRSTYSADNLYFRYDMKVPHGLVNTQPDPKFLFKGGNALDIQIQTEDLKTEDLKGNPVRLLVTRQDGKTKAMLYFKNTPAPSVFRSLGLQSSAPFTFTSPTGEETFAHIEDVSDIITLDYQEVPDGLVATVTVPQALLGLALRPGQEVTMDVGYLFGNKEGNQTMARAYWSNNGFSANVVLDIPNESRLVPEEWGTAVIE